MFFLTLHDKEKHRGIAAHLHEMSDVRLVLSRLVHKMRVGMDKLDFMLIGGDSTPPDKFQEFYIFLLRAGAHILQANQVSGESSLVFDAREGVIFGQNQQGFDPEVSPPDLLARDIVII